MTDHADGSGRILGSLRAEGGQGIVRIEERLSASINDVWSALTEPPRLSQWYGEVEGDLRVDGEFRVRHVDGERVGRVVACVPLERLLVTLRDTDPRPGQPEEIGIDVLVAATDDQTSLAVETSGLPLELLWAYGVGTQIHVEHLTDHISGRESVDNEARWNALAPRYEELARDVR